MKIADCVCQLTSSFNDNNFTTLPLTVQGNKPAEPYKTETIPLKHLSERFFFVGFVRICAGSCTTAHS